MPIKLALLLITLFSLSACSKYQFTLNETVVHTPPALFTDFQTADKSLQNCLDQTIKDQNITSPQQLTLLSCSHAGIKSLDGLEVFSNLSHVNLGNNQLQRVQALGKMGRIETLLLNDNQLQSAPEILTLPKLQKLDLANNSNLDCGDLRQLQKSYTGDLTIPEQCRP
ncbi:leucine-rich repeat domain-containing protein [Candidatus Pelagadaptatus aseana]|uniref:leucine-rich repeat domain-containing protein n=1 Tax=Candidatus Pelagadaptatus aseana TaxID=3120508 RepID=UPI003C7051CF